MKNWRSAVKTGCVILTAACLVVLSGCGVSQDPGTADRGTERQAASKQDDGVATQAGARGIDGTQDPVSAAKVFLEAVRTGDDEKVVAMFTELARQQAGELNRQFAPVGSDTARYTVSDKVDYLGDEGARIMSTWTDLGADGKPRSDEIMWMLRKEPGGWRIAGMAAVIFPGEPPLLLDFENMKETLRKVEMLAEEMERRQSAQQTAATSGAETEGQLPAQREMESAGADVVPSQDVQYTPSAALPDRTPADPTMRK